ncbi:hypothetical protein GR158_04730 [Shinella sp. AETb1-6]|uniref:hypothetical protein n=1 Tax=Shinella sp. AETb1-6 TaxID=2692210 RepID=UPI00136AA1CF|nr:hypothetical protein [Shinella sp. AETb1-6]MXN50408.1 hypothetical protein [Shinella sp. AETb1-6]
MIPTDPDLIQSRYQYAALNVEMRALTLSLHLKAGFRADQPRIPAGNPDGGQWTAEGDGDRPILVSRRGPRGNGQVRILGRWQPITPAQEARLAVSTSQMQEAIRAVRKIDPNWKPPSQLFESVEGLIRANEAVMREAHFRVYELTVKRIGPGPFASEWIVAPSTNRRLTRAEQDEINRIGRKFGCHRCGTKIPGTKKGGYVGDHQVPTSLGTPTRIYPHCLFCSNAQGGIVSGGKF